ncbi:MAG TPA: YqaJ viral recombinase family protein [Xanthobacteraceae bacterium]|nr:YqaJ viral recombinase family protein [Xanthobacteraceae bacterium]
MSVEIINVAQGTPEWFAARAGIPTASEFHSILAKGRGDKPSAVRRAYMVKLASEILTGDAGESFSNRHTERGHEMEGEARDLYALTYDVEPVQVGFLRNGMKGCSPDSLIGERGMLEIKSKLPHLLVGIIADGVFPPEHQAQCQGALWVAEREWIDIAVYWRGLPLFVKRAWRDEAYIASLAKEVVEFNAELAELVESIRQYRAPALDMAA